jgi:hypothetical protein
MTEIVDQAIKEGDQLGYFAALYRRTTWNVKTALDRGEFADNPRMEKMMTRFANRYFEALTLYRAGQKPTSPWLLSFDVAKNPRTTLAQHLFLGMNAHINLDLGIAAAQTMVGENIEEFEGDFTKINEILAAMLGPINDEFGQIWPIFSRINAFFGGRQQKLFSQGMDDVRAYAWGLATKLAPIPAADEQSIIDEYEKAAFDIGNSVAAPWFPFNLAVWLLRVTNSKSVTQTIEILAT